MKIIRILVYDGDEDFVRKSLNSTRGVIGERITPHGSIKEFYIQSPLTLPSHCPFDIEAEE